MADHLRDTTKKVDFISREVAITEILSEPTDAHYPSWFAEKLKQVPAADVRPVVRGKWIPSEEIKGYDVCSACHNCYIESNWKGVKWKFCPQCGADMREVKNDA